MKNKQIFEIDTKLLEAIDKLIAKYSNNYWRNSLYACPLCNLYYNYGVTSCKNDCPNNIELFDNTTELGCYGRGMKYPNLYYGNFSNAESLKAFWSNYKTLYLQQNRSNEEIMKLLVGDPEILANAINLTNISNIS